MGQRAFFPMTSVHADTQPCQTHTAHVRRILQGGVCRCIPVGWALTPTAGQCDQLAASAAKRETLQLSRTATHGTGAGERSSRAADDAGAGAAARKKQGTALAEQEQWLNKASLASPYPGAIYMQPQPLHVPQSARAGATTPTSEAGGGGGVGGGTVGQSTIAQQLQLLNDAYDSPPQKTSTCLPSTACLPAYSNPFVSEVSAVHFGDREMTGVCRTSRNTAIAGSDTQAMLGPMSRYPAGPAAAAAGGGAGGRRQRRGGCP